MFQTRVSAILTIAGVLAVGSAAVTDCYGGGTTNNRLLAPSGAPHGTDEPVSGTGCLSIAGHPEVFLATAADPSTRLTQAVGGVEAGGPGDWTAILTIPQTLAPGSGYIIGAQCWGDGTAQGLPGQQVLYFAYTSAPFTVELAQGELAVAPSDGTAGTVVTVQGTGCDTSVIAGHVEVFLVTTADPSTRLAEVNAAALGDWSATLTIPQTVAPGSDYLVGAQCWGDGYAQGHPGQQVLFFSYTSEPFTVD
jgi:hypothetical protein